MGTARTHVRTEEGFSLTELMVVLLVIGVLISIAIPTFLRPRSSAQDRSAQQGLRNSLIVAKAEWAKKETFADIDATAMNAAETNLTFVTQTTDSTGPRIISVNPVSDDVWVAAALSETGTCYAIRDDARAGTTYAKLPTGTCKAQRAAAEAAFSPTGWA